MKARTFDVERLATGVMSGDRAAIARAITLVESLHPDHRLAARAMLTALVEHTDSRPDVTRVGISGVPGVGKSTFIETLGTHLTTSGITVGVLTVDPSSVRTGGSVLGDKTRMSRLAVDPLAYIRPSPSAGTLGGVTRATAQAIVVLEAAGFEAIIVETVGVGQSEITVASMVDTFLYLTLSRTGDQLQGIKKGILEIADVIAVNKADDREAEARSAARELASALRLVHGGRREWVPPVLTCSALTGDGVAEVWTSIREHRSKLGPDGLGAKRADQRWDLTWALVRDEMESRLRRSTELAVVREDVRAGKLQATAAADRIIDSFGGRSATLDGS